jgi:glutamine synthetase
MTAPPVALRASDADRERAVEVPRGPLTADLPVAPERCPEADEAPYIVFVVLVGAWIAAVTALGVFIPPLPLLLFLLYRVTKARRWRAA